MKCKKDFGKRGQSVFGISFGVIFSIILIVFIVIVGIIVVKAFLGWGDVGGLKLFIDSFKDEINRAYQSDGLSFEFNGKVGLGVEYVCFFNSSKGIRGQWEDIGFEIDVFDNENMFFYPLEEASNSAHKIGRLDIGEITKINNPKCFRVSNGRVKFRIEKEMNKGLVEVR